MLRLPSIILLTVAFCMMLFAAGCKPASNNNKPKDLIAGQVYTFHSKILDEDRTIWISFPHKDLLPDYSSAAQYPVAYVLDGDAHFHTVTATSKYLSQYNGNTLSMDMIVVGILNTERSRDLTPMEDRELEETNGGADRFLLFMEKELFPFVDSICHPSPYKMLIGHSYGGLFALNALVSDKQLFNSYIINDPSVNWKQYKFLDTVIAKINRSKLSDRKLFVAAANPTNQYVDLKDALDDTTETTGMIRGIFKLRDVMMDDTTNKPDFSFMYYPYDNHGSIPPSALSDGLRFCFEDIVFRRAYSLLEPEITADSALNIVVRHFKSVSAQWHTTFFPEESLMNNLGYFFMADKSMEKARVFFQYNLDHFPDSPNAFDSMADYYAQKGDGVRSRAMRMKAKSLED